MNFEPLVSVNILCFNRKDELRNTLTKVYEQDYKNIEVIVVDNASTDDTCEMVKSEFPEVILIQLEKNIGIAGWNKGFEIAKGEYVLVLDDDAYPSVDAIDLAIKKFQLIPDLGAIAFNVIDINSNKSFWAGTWLPKMDIIEIIWPIFVGCAVIFTKEKFVKESLFPQNVFIYQHELFVAAKIYSNQKSVLYDKSITAYHNCKGEKLYNFKTDQYIFQNNLIFILEYLPAIIYPLHAFHLSLFYFFRSLNHDWIKEYFAIIINAVKLSYRKDRVQTTLNHYLQLRKLHLFNFSITKGIMNFIK